VEVLRDLRSAEGVTRAEIACRTNRTRQAIEVHENSDAKIEIQTVVSLLKGYGYRTEFFVSPVENAEVSESDPGFLSYYSEKTITSVSLPHLRDVLGVDQQAVIKTLKGWGISGSLATSIEAGMVPRLDSFCRYVRALDADLLALLFSPKRQFPPLVAKWDLNCLNRSESFLGAVGVNKTAYQILSTTPKGGDPLRAVKSGAIRMDEIPGLLAPLGGQVEMSVVNGERTRYVLEF
jgi:transcriptional regulator with XRE-family HTH domain